jgi:predicted ribosome quality control (RQC) complex YloA/Tae2 family protein
VHLQQGRVKRHDGPIGPFFQALENELLGAELRRIAQVMGDRIVIVEFKGESGKRALLVELFGRRANAVLMGSGDKVIALATEVPPKKGSEPRLVVGEEWKPPGMGAPPADPGPSIEEAFAAPTEEPPGKAKDRAPLSWRVESSLGLEAEVAHAEDARRTLRQRVKRRIGRAEGLIKGLLAKAEAADGADRVRQDGELLKSMLGTFDRGTKSVEVQDWFVDGAPPRNIEVDPKLSANENVQRYFDRFHKLERAKSTVMEEIERAETRLKELQELSVRAEDTTLDAEKVDDEAVAQGLLDRRQVADVRKKKKAAPRKPYKSFVGSKGSEIRVGRTARDNDTLSIRLARGSDYWLHTADVPGSHVILVTDKGQEPHQEEIMDAAHLAIHFSPVRGTDRAPVHVVQRKHLHKPKGAKPGLVTLSGGRILEVRMQPDRLNALLRGPGQERGGRGDS